MKGQLFWVALCAAACSEPAERPDTISVCQVRCEGGYVGGDGDDTTSTTGSNPGGDGTTVSGDVAVFVDEEFAGTEPWGNEAVVLAPGAEQAIVDGEFDGELFRVDNVAERTAAWFLTEPADSSLISPLPALWLVDTTRSDMFDLYMVNRDVIEEILAGLTVQTTIAAGRAQVVIRLVDANGDPAPGVGIQSNDGEFIAYYSGTSWTDQDSATDSSGLAMVGNVLAPDYPGRGMQVVVTAAEQQDVVLDVVEDAVTMAEVLVE